MATTGSKGQIRRVFRLLERLRGNRVGIALDPLATGLRASKPQIRRDIAVLRRVGVRVDIVRCGRISIVKLVEDHAGWVPITRREYDELMGLLRMLDVVQHDEYPAAVTLFKKLETMEFVGDSPTSRKEAGHEEGSGSASPT